MRVSPHARRRPDRSGDPLDGLVNLFELGIVLAIAFLLVALETARREAPRRPAPARRAEAVIAPAGSQVTRAGSTSQRIIGRGRAVGTAYRLSDGRLVVVRPPR